MSDEQKYVIPEKAEDFEIDLKDMCFHILKKWRVIILAACIGLLIGCAVAVISNQASEEYDPFEPGMEYELNIIQDLDYQYQRYLESVELAKQDYRYTLDEDTEYYHGAVYYYMGASNAQEAELVLSYLNFMRDTESVKELAELLDFHGNINTITSVLSVGMGVNQTTDSVILQGAEERPTYGSITVYLNMLSDEQFDKVAEFADRKLQEYQAKYADEIGKGIVIRKTHASKTAYDNDVVAAAKKALKQSEVDQLTNYMKAINEGVLSTSNNKENIKYIEDTEKLLDYYYINYRPDLDNEERLARNTLSVKSVLKTGIIVGIVLAILSAGVALLAYLMGGVLRTVRDVTERYGLKLVGFIYTDDKKKDPITRAIEKWSAKGKRAQSTTPDYVAAVIDQIGLPAACVDSEDAENNVLSEIKTGVKAPVHVSSLRKDAALLEQAIEVGMVYLHVTLNKTTNRELDDVLNVCRLHGIGVAGVIVTEQV